MRCWGTMRAVMFAMLLAAAAAPALAQEAPAPAPGATARAHFDRGAALTEEHRYSEAAAAFEAAFTLDPRKETLFAWAQVARLGGNCTAAIPLYRRFLEEPNLTASQRGAAELSIRRCESTPDRADPAAAAPVVPPAAAAPPAAETGATAPPAEPSPASGSDDTAALRVPRASTAPASSDVQARPSASRRGLILRVALIAGAVTALGGAGTFFQLGRNDERTATSKLIWDDYYVAVSRAHDRQLLAAGLAGISVLLGAGAALHWWLSDPEPPLTAWVNPRALGLQGRF
jgi:tetratricopeptide (TPR) repeat protein